jgi:hypothetical protein
MNSKADMKEIEAKLKSQAKDNILQEHNGEKDNITKEKRKQKGAANKMQKKTRTEEPLFESGMKYLCLVWSPILEALFLPGEEIRLIAGESINK